MGYSTYFKGALKFAKPLTAEQELKLNEMFDGEIDLRNEDDAKKFPIKAHHNLGYIDFKINKEKTGIEHNGSEKSYYSVEAVNFILNVMQCHFHDDFQLEGALLAQGEEVGDVWKLKIVDGKAIREEIEL